jgi:hypothetical protein
MFFFVCVREANDLPQEDIHIDKKYLTSSGKCRKGYSNKMGMIPATKNYYTYMYVWVYILGNIL